jgi:four helix bundle protein
MQQADKGYHKLIAWQEAHRLTLAVYKATEAFPRTELFGLTSEMRRAAVSVAANIVEGQARRSSNEFALFLDIANGSLVELEYYLELARDLGLLLAEPYDAVESIRLRVRYILHGLRASPPARR